MGLSLGREEGRQREPGLDSLGKGRREKKNSGVKTWCLRGGGGGYARRHAPPEMPG